MSTTTLIVRGMTCGHCAASVTEELQEVPQVSDVRVNLIAGQDSPVEVDSEGDLDLQAARAAITEAGYTLVD